MALASSSSKRSLTGSHFSFLPRRMLMLPMWQTVAEWWPISTGQIVCLRERLLFSSVFSYYEHLPTSLEVTRCPRRSAALAITR